MNQVIQALGIAPRLLINNTFSVLNLVICLEKSSALLVSKMKRGFLWYRQFLLQSLLLIWRGWVKLHFVTKFGYEFIKNKLCWWHQTPLWCRQSPPCNRIWNFVGSVYPCKSLQGLWRLITVRYKFLQTLGIKARQKHIVHKGNQFFRLWNLLLNPFARLLYQCRVELGQQNLPCSCF